MNEIHKPCTKCGATTGHPSGICLMCQPDWPNSEARSSTELPPETMFHVYARVKGCEQWYKQESSKDISDVLYWRDRNNEQNRANFEDGAGREYIAVKSVTTFAILETESK